MTPLPDSDSPSLPSWLVTDSPDLVHQSGAGQKTGTKLKGQGQTWAGQGVGSPPGNDGALVKD